MCVVFFSPIPFQMDVSMVSPQIAMLEPIVKVEPIVPVHSSDVFAFEHEERVLSEHREHMHRDVHRDMHCVVGELCMALALREDIRSSVKATPLRAFSAGLGLMRWGSPNVTKKPKTPAAPSRTFDENVSSPPKKKLHVDHTTSPDFYRGYSRVYSYELSMDMPEPPSVKRMPLE
jgi:hypothetical protein